jgi:hypothetical protein
MTNRPHIVLWRQSPFDAKFTKVIIRCRSDSNLAVRVTDRHSFNCFKPELVAAARGIINSATDVDNVMTC